MASPPEWISTLTAALANHLIAAALPAPLGAHIQKAAEPTEAGAEIWEVSVFYGKTEIVGGPQDGRRTDSAFWLDLNRVGELFSRIDGFYWQATPLGPADDLGPHVAIEGEYGGHAVRVRFLSAAPSRFPSARSADTNKGMFIDLW